MGKCVTKRVRADAVNASYAQVHDRHVRLGRFFTEADEKTRRQVVVLVRIWPTRFFGNQHPKEETSLVGNASFPIIEVEECLGNRFANSGWTRKEMEGVLVPLATYRAYINGGKASSS